MATRKAKRSRGKRARAKRSAVVIVNPPKHRRRRHVRRNPRLSLGHVLSSAGNGLIGGGTIVATEVGTRLIRARLLKMPAGTMLSGLTEVVISTTAGVLAGQWLGDRIGQLIVDAGFASVFRATAKQMKTPLVSDALSDDGRLSYTIRDGRVVRNAGMGAYVAGRGAAAARLNGYVPGRQQRPLGGYVPGSGAAEMASAAAQNNRSGV
jgi:hypothetical protein